MAEEKENKDYNHELEELRACFSEDEFKFFEIEESVKTAPLNKGEKHDWRVHYVREYLTKDNFNSLKKFVDELRCILISGPSAECPLSIYSFFHRVECLEDILSKDYETRFKYLNNAWSDYDPFAFQILACDLGYKPQTEAEKRLYELAEIGLDNTDYDNDYWANMDWEFDQTARDLDVAFTARDGILYKIIADKSGEMPRNEIIFRERLYKQGEEGIKSKINLEIFSRAIQDIDYLCKNANPYYICNLKQFALKRQILIDSGYEWVEGVRENQEILIMKASPFSIGSEFLNVYRIVHSGSYSYLIEKYQEKNK